MNRPNVISLCAGSGIAEIGIHKHFQTKVAVDNDWRCCCSHIANHEGIHVVHGNVCSKKVTEYAQKCATEIDGIIHTPPCPAFSSAGNKNPKDKRTEPFLSVLEWVKEFDPKFVFLENVSGVRKSPHFLILIQRLQFLGYQVQTWLLDAADYGVPQHRERLFMVAVRDGIAAPVMPEPTHGSGQANPYRTIRDAIGDLTEDEAMSMGCAPLSAKRTEIMKAVQPGGNWQDLRGWRRKAVLAACKGKKPHPRTCRRYDWGETPGTILTGPQVRHVTMPLPPHVNRPFSVVEYLRLMGIRREFHLFGSIKDRYRMVGNGVPPGLMSAVCRSVGDALGARKN